MAPVSRSLRRALGAGAVAGATLIAGLAFAPAASASPGQTVTPLGAGDPAALVAQLVGDDTTVSNITVTGSTDSIGTFSGMSAVGIDEGVALSTGHLRSDRNILAGPNTDDAFGDNTYMPGDPDLTALTDNDTFDAIVLEFDFVPTTDTLSFEYVFGSDEYLEFVNARVNDSFAFFVNGTNVATFDDGSGTPQFVSIDTINHELNTDLFVNNTSATHDTEMDGFTVPLGINAAVEAGVTNHIKMVIADGGDSMLNSAVLIKAGSFRSNTAPVATPLSLTTPLDTAIDVTLQGTDAENDPLTYTVVNQPQNGTLSGMGSALTFTPTTGFTGTTTFTYTVSDGSLTSEPATVTIEVGGPVPTTTPPQTTPAETTPPAPTPATTIPVTPAGSTTPTAVAGDDGLASTGGEASIMPFAIAGALLLVGAGAVSLAAIRRKNA